MTAESYVLSSAQRTTSFGSGRTNEKTYSRDHARSIRWHRRAHAQSYPTRPVTVIVPYPAGGPTDQVARQIGPKLAAKLGQNFVIENVSGGGTNIAGQRVARSAPDGYTLFVHNLQFSANVSLYNRCRSTPRRISCRSP